MALSSTRKVLRVGKTYPDTPTLHGVVSYNNKIVRLRTDSFFENRALRLDLYLRYCIADSAVDT